MHTIEPYYKWRDLYTTDSDPQSPFYGTVYSEFSYSKKVYNYFIHPQWDEFGSSTLYLKVIYVDYNKHQAVIELIGEWNDAINNDIMFLKREVIEALTDKGIRYFVLTCENVMNFHGSDDCYYEEWSEDVNDLGGYICFINLFDHVIQEMEATGLQFFANLGPHLNEIAWRGKQPLHLFYEVENRLNSGIKQLRY